MSEGCPKCQVWHGFKGALQGAVAVPQFYQFVATGGNDPSIHAIARTKGATTMAGPRADLSAVFHFPLPDGAVFRAAKENIAILSPAHFRDSRRVTTQVEIFASSKSFPYHEARAAVGGGQKHTIGAEFEGCDPVGVLFDFMQKFTVACCVNAQHLSGAANGNKRLVWADVGGKDGIGVGTNGGYPLTRRHIENDSAAERASPATGHQHQAAVAAEFNDCWQAFRIRQCAQKILRISVIEQYLLLPAHSNKRSPRAGRYCEHGIRATRLHKRFLGQWLGWHRGRTSRPATHNRRQSDIGLGGSSERFAAGIFGCSGADPGAHEFNFVVGHLGSHWRHERLGFVRHGGIERRFVRIARLDYRARTATFHDLREVGDNQSTALLVAGMAIRALLHQKWQNVLIVGDLGRRLACRKTCKKADGKNHGVSIRRVTAPRGATGSLSG